jgi:uncharacterized protein YdeI (YjbR/CyaY-like superfamily)
VTTARPEIFFDSVAAFAEWLEKDASQTGIWAIYFKKSSGKSDLYWETLVTTCLRFGWIDSLPGRVDEERTKTYISPRRAGSGWSRKNQVTILQLEQEGLLHSKGQAVLDRARADGSWTLFDKAEDLVIPDQLKDLFASNPVLQLGWERSSEARRRQELQIFYAAKTATTMQKRLESLIGLANSNA